MLNNMIALSFLLGLAGYLLSLCVQRIVILEHERGVMHRRGRLIGIASPGVHWLFRPWEQVQKIDARPGAMSITGQEVLTADNICIRLSLAARLEISDPLAAITRSTSYLEQLHQDAQLALRELVGRYPLGELLTRRNELGQMLLEMVTPKAAGLGLKLHELGIRDIMLPPKLRDAFLQVVHAERAGEAALVRARSEVAANRALLNAARMLEQNPGLVTMRSLQALSDAGRTPGTTVVFGLPPSAVPVTVRANDDPAARPGGSEAAPG